MSVTKPELPNPLSPEHLADPFPGYRTLRDHFPIVWHEPTQSWMLSRYEHVRPMLRDNTNWSTEHMQEQLGACLGDAPTLTAMDGRAHTAQRSLVSPFLHSAGLEGFRSAISDRARALLDPIFERERGAVASGERERGELDLVGEFSALYPVDVVAAMMDLPDTDYGDLQRWYNAFIQFVGNIAQDPELVERGLTAKQEFGDYILPLIADRRAQGDGEDLISQLCRSEVGGRVMTDEEIRTFLALVVLAGGETTDHQIAALLHALAEHPDQLQELQEDRSLMDATLAEGMRYCSIVQFIQRTAREDVEVDGHEFPAGTKVTLMLAAANHDPRRFEDADEFSIHRTDNSVSRAFTGSSDHVGFGGGRHQCVGSHLSQAESEIALTMLLDNATDIRLADGWEPSYAFLPFIRSLLDLRLTYSPVE